ncbi:MAG: cation transporter [Synergistaceae bacterium]|nr:cation transporter [Synergistaceae bacterium]
MEMKKGNRLPEERERGIVRVSLVGIAVNVLLAGFKFFVGLMSNSIAIMIDALNNASDVLSSVITVAGAKLAGRPADKEHPFGHGRVEYLSAAVVSAVILYAGVTAFSESVRKILHPLTPEYTGETLLIVAAAVVAKFLLGRYVKGAGRRLRSDALENSGQDALLDSAVSASTLLAAVIFLTLNLNLEAWLGAFISLLIIKAGIDMFRETTSKILGERVESGLARAVKETVCETEGVFGAYDLVLSSYGPERLMGSVHIEVPDTWTADKIDMTSREIARRVFTEHHVLLAAIGIYSRNSTSDAVKEIRTRVTEAVMSEDYVLQIHGFYCDTREKKIRLDLVVDFLAPTPESVHRKVLDRLQGLYPDYAIEIQIDTDFSD